MRSRRLAKKTGHQGGFSTKTSQKPIRRIFTMRVVVLSLAASILLFIAGRVPLTTPFSASIHTKALSFSLGHWAPTGGLFNSELSRMNITLHTHCRIEANKTLVSEATSEGLVLERVKLQSLIAVEKMKVSLQLLSGSLLVRLEPPAGTKPYRFASVLLDEKSKVSDPRFPALRSRTNVEWAISAVQVNHIELSLRFLDQTPKAETDIPLAEQEPLSFYFYQQERTGIFGVDNRLTLLNNSDRPISVEGGLSLGMLREAKLERLSLHSAVPFSGEKPTIGLSEPAHRAIDIDSIDVTVAGKSKEIVLTNSVGKSNVSSTATSNLTGLFIYHGPLLGAIGALFTAIYAIAYVVKEFVMRKDDQPR